jgi:hypothetical protein
MNSKCWFLILIKTLFFFVLSSSFKLLGQDLGLSNQNEMAVETRHAIDFGRFSPGEAKTIVVSVDHRPSEKSDVISFGKSCLCTDVKLFEKNIDSIKGDAAQQEIQGEFAPCLKKAE